MLLTTPVRHRESWTVLLLERGSLSLELCSLPHSAMVCNAIRRVSDGSDATLMGMEERREQRRQRVTGRGREGEGSEGGGVGKGCGGVAGVGTTGVEG